jgi:hypothetical protein
VPPACFRSDQRKPAANVLGSLRSSPWTVAPPGPRCQRRLEEDAARGRPRSDDRALRPGTSPRPVLVIMRQKPQSIPPGSDAAKRWRIGVGVVPPAPGRRRPSTAISAALLFEREGGAASCAKVVCAISQPRLTPPIRFSRARTPKGLAELGAAGDLPQRANTEAGRFHVDDQIAEPRAWRPAVRRARRTPQGRYCA